MKLKQVLIVRKDLNMRKGKIGGQCAHAAEGALFIGAEKSVDQAGSAIAMIPLDPELGAWISDDKLKTKIVVSVDSEAALLDLRDRARETGLRHYLVQDAGLTEFSGIPTYTVLAIGPCAADKVDPLTMGLPLL